MSRKHWSCLCSGTTVAATWSQMRCCCMFFLQGETSPETSMPGQICVLPLPFSIFHPIRGGVKKRGDCVHKWMLAKTSEWPRCWPQGLSVISYGHCWGDVSHKETGRPDCFRSSSVDSLSAGQTVASYYVLRNSPGKDAEYCTGDFSSSACGTKVLFSPRSMYWYPFLTC